MLKGYLICFMLATISVWLVEYGSKVIVHSSGGLGLIALLCPGMLPVFYGVFDNEYLGWFIASGLTGLYYCYVLNVSVVLKKHRKV